MKLETLPSEMRYFKDPRSGRDIRQLTCGAGDEYHLYYQAYPMTSDGKWLVFYSRRKGSTDLYGLNLSDGTIARLTKGRSKNSGWWPETALSSEGVYDFISCIHPETGRVFYHDLDEVRVVDLESGENRIVATGPTEMRPVSQMACSFDGSFIATAWTHKSLTEKLAEDQERREKISGAELDTDEYYHPLSSRLEIIDTATGESTTLIELNVQISNMAITTDNRHVVVGPYLEHGEPWAYLLFDRLNPGEFETRRVPIEGGSICHYHACRDGRLLFDAFSKSGTSIGWIDLESGNCRAWNIAQNSYCHVGHDREGGFLFASVDNFNAAEGHHIAAYDLTVGSKLSAERLTDDLPTGRNQFCHAHPILTPDRKSIIYTAVGNDDNTHLFQIDISDLDTTSPTTRSQ